MLVFLYLSNDNDFAGNVSDVTYSVICVFSDVNELLYTRV